MNKLEQQLKDSFDHFEPEVNPSVWDNIQAQLPASAPLSTDITSSVTNSGKGLFGPATGWIAAAAVVLTAGVIVWKLNSQDTQDPDNRTHTVTTQPIPKTDIPIESNENPAVLIPANPKENGKPAVVKTEQATVASDFSGHSSIVSQELNTQNSENEKTSSSTTEKLSEELNSSRINPAPAKPSAEKNTGTSSSPNSGESTSQNNLTGSKATIITKAEPALMVNSRCGFAPLMVAAMTNIDGHLCDYDFGDGTVSKNVVSANHSYSEPGIYKLTCNTGDKTLETTIEIIGRINTVFSPNGDGVNDVFSVGGQGVKTAVMKIYDRAGKLLFTGSGQLVSWDGRINGAVPAETGTYIYDIFATSESGVTSKQKGIINLFR